MFVSLTLNHRIKSLVLVFYIYIYVVSTRHSSFFDLWLFLRTWPHTPQAFLETSRQASHILRERRTATTPGTSRPTLHEQCVGSLILNMEGIVRQDLRFIVLIREDWKV